MTLGVFLMYKVYYATSSRRKVEMAKSFLKSCSDVTIEQVNIDLVEEQTLNLESIAISKAKQAWDFLGKPVLVDDSGFYLNRYHEFPGTMTKFVCKSLGLDGLYRLYDEGDKVYFVTNLVFINEDGYKLFTGRIDGTLIKPEIVHDVSEVEFTKVTIPNDSDVTMYEAMKRKGYSEYDPRIIALKKFLEFIKTKN